MMWFTICGAVALYILGFFLGRKYEKDKILDGVCAVVSEVNKHDMMVDSVTYYYNEEAYDAKIKELKENGKEYYDE